MSHYRIRNILTSAPFLALGAAFILGALWLLAGRLSEGLAWKDGDGLVAGFLVVMLIFAGAFIQFGLNALTQGHTKKSSKKLISPAFYYVIALFFIVPGAWIALYGSTNALIVIAVGVGIAVYGYKLSRAMGAELAVQE